MLQSIYQLTPHKALVDKRFHPFEDCFMLLYHDGKMIYQGFDGKQHWEFDFKCRPLGFRISDDGQFIAVLCDQKLILLDQHTLDLKTYPVDDKFRLLEFYKNCVVLGGFLKSLLIIKPNGHVLQQIDFEEYVRSFTVIPEAHKIIVYNQDRQVICVDVKGKIDWALDYQTVTSQIAASLDGQQAFFIRYPRDLIKFDVNGQDLFLVRNDYTPKQIALSANGRYLLTLDINDGLCLFDRSLTLIWRHEGFAHLKQMEISPNGNFILIDDVDGIITIYATNPSAQTASTFFELEDNSQVVTRSHTWAIKPGLYDRRMLLNTLTSDPTAYHMGVIGMDGDVYFIDEQGQTAGRTRFYAHIDHMGIAASSQWGYVNGEQQLTLIDFANRKEHKLHFPQINKAKPIVNFYHHLIMIPQESNQMLLFDFDGKPIGTIKFTHDFHKGFSCEPFGFACYDGTYLKLIDPVNKKQYTINLPDVLCQVRFIDNHIIGTTQNHGVVKFDLNDPKSRHGKIKSYDNPIRMIQSFPILIIENETTLIRLDQNLKTIHKQPIQSRSSQFFVTDQSIFEISCRFDKIYCYNEHNQLLFRYTADGPIRETATTKDGICLITPESLIFLRLTESSQRIFEIADFLEL